MYNVRAKVFPLFERGNLPNICFCVFHGKVMIVLTGECEFDNVFCGYGLANSEGRGGGEAKRLSFSCGKRDE